MMKWKFLTLACIVLLWTGMGPARAGNIIINGGFETGTFSSWTNLDQAGGSGSWFIQTGTVSPLNGFTVPAPPQGMFAAMTDQFGPGSHVLYQDFVVPFGVSSATLNFQLFINNQNGAFITPNTLDYSGDPNQQSRVDIITTAADPFSVAGGDVLQNVYQTQVGDPATSGYSLVSVDLTALLAAHGGETLRLRFAETDDQFFFQTGVDDVILDAQGPQAVPEPASLSLLCIGALGLLTYRWKHCRKLTC
jgi:hypothetical protein